MLFKLPSSARIFVFLATGLQLSSFGTCLDVPSSTAIAEPNLDGSPVPTADQVAHAIQILNQAGVDWARPSNNNSNKGTNFVEFGCTIHLMGVDPDDLTIEEEAFMEDGLPFTFNLVNGNSDYTLMNNHLISKTSESEDDGPDSGEDDGPDDGKAARNSYLRLGKRRRRRKSKGSVRASVGGACRYCGKNMLTLTGTHTPGLATSSDLVVPWETQFKKLLLDSRYDVFHTLEDLTIEVLDTKLDAAAAPAPADASGAKSVSLLKKNAMVL